MKENSTRIDLAGLVIILFVIIFFPLIQGHLNILSILNVLLVSFGFWGIGYSVLGSSGLFNSISSTTQHGLYVFGGATSSFLLLSTTSYPFSTAIIILLSSCVSIFHLIRKKVEFKAIPLPYALAFIFSLLMFFYGNNAIESLAGKPIQSNNVFIDNIFYTSITASLKEGSIYNAFFEIGSSLNYHVGGFFGAASYATLTDTSSHIATWGIWVPLLRFLSLLMIGELGVLVINRILPANNNRWVFFTVILLYVFAAPINPTHIFNLNIEKIIWIGTPYTIPDMPALASGFLLSLTAIWLVISDNLKRNQDKFLFIVIISFIISCKVTYYFALMFFLGIIALHQSLLKKNHSLLSTITASLPFTYVTYKIFFTSDKTTTILLEPGYLAEYFSYLATGSSGSLATGLLIAFLSIIIIWIGIKYLGLYFILKDKEHRVLIFASLGSITGSILLASIFRIYQIDDSGTVFKELSYDLLQFIKASLSLISVIGVVGLMVGFHKIVQRPIKIAYLVFIGIWSAVILISIIKNEHNKKPDVLVAHNQWVKAVEIDIKRLKTNGLLAMTSSNKNSGLLLTAGDIGPWWSTFSGSEGGVTTTIENNYRQVLIIDFIKTGSLSSLDQIRSENVEYIIGIPENIHLLNALATQRTISKIGVWTFSVHNETLLEIESK